MRETIVGIMATPFWGYCLFVDGLSPGTILWLQRELSVTFSCTIYNSGLSGIFYRGARLDKKVAERLIYLN
jgi:hypothetical protein